MMTALEGVVMEMQDCALPLLDGKTINKILYYLQIYAVLNTILVQ